MACKSFSHLWLAVEYNDQKTVKNLISNGVDINHRFMECGHRRHGQTPLAIAASKNYRDMINILLKAGADLEQEDLFGDTPLFHAVKSGKLPTIKYLIDAGAKINHKNKIGDSVLALVVRCGRKNLVEYLLANKADPDLLNKGGLPALMIALELHGNCCGVGHCTRKRAPSNMKEIIELLVPVMKNLNYSHPDMGTALRLALTLESKYSRENLHISKLLMQHGAIPDRLFFLKFPGLNASNSLPGSELYTHDFFSLAILAGASLQREKAWIILILREMPEELEPHEELFKELVDSSVVPQTLENIVCMALRKMLGGPLWVKIDALELPKHIKEKLKLKIL